MGICMPSRLLSATVTVFHRYILPCVGTGDRDGYVVHGFLFQFSTTTAGRRATTQKVLLQPVYRLLHRTNHLIKQLVIVRMSVKITIDLNTIYVAYT